MALSRIFHLLAFDFLYLVDPGKARGGSTNTVVNESLIAVDLPKRRRTATEVVARTKLPGPEN